MRYLKILLAILLLICLFDMPYGYYQLVRTIAMIIFAMLAYTEFQTKPLKTLFWVYVGLAILFQPISKIALGRDLWNIVDVIVAIGLFISTFRQSTVR